MVKSDAKTIPRANPAGLLVRLADLEAFAAGVSGMVAEEFGLHPVMALDALLHLLERETVARRGRLNAERARAERAEADVRRLRHDAVEDREHKASLMRRTDEKGEEFYGCEHGTCLDCGFSFCLATGGDKPGRIT